MLILKYSATEHPKLVCFCLPLSTGRYIYKGITETDVLLITVLLTLTTTPTWLRLNNILFINKSMNHDLIFPNWCIFGGCFILLVYSINKKSKFQILKIILPSIKIYQFNTDMVVMVLIQIWGNVIIPSSLLFLFTSLQCIPSLKC